ncbi:YaaC family protein [Vannielia litorea]|uniref:YaaC family protein n=1 Tax=Vannielia litorea TaxID=1217970 RepID=UPI001C967DCE|nr:YaaC family protein [Vannielia litorea]MBY6050030.1 YaaC family protein [Vannielia litorea]MBY6077444.1 YaaC family protein [Vannielia litorea]
MLDASVWSKLSWLESQDAVGTSYERLHKRSLNTRRRLEITAAAKQAREYFVQASRSDLSVRPLLTFYGVSSLSRACVLLIGKHEGESSLQTGHGLRQVGWRNKLNGNLATALEGLNALSVETCDGLYLDLAKHTNNQNCLHTNSSAVDWSVSYEVPQSGQCVSLESLVSRMPDLKEELTTSGIESRFEMVNNISYSQDSGLLIKKGNKKSSSVFLAYEELGYTRNSDVGSEKLSCSSDIFAKSPVQLLNSLVDLPFPVPNLFLVEPLWGGVSQICFTFKISFILGMLARYFPTHWMNLINGAKGDRHRSIIIKCQRVVEVTFPFLIEELIRYNETMVEKG